MRLYFTRTETIAIEVPNPDGKSVHKADAEAWANLAYDGRTRLEAEARGAAEGQAETTTTGWTLTKVEGAPTTENIFGALPLPPRKRGPRPAGDGAGTQQQQTEG